MPRRARDDEETDQQWAHQTAPAPRAVSFSQSITKNLPSGQQCPKRLMRFIVLVSSWQIVRCKAPIA